jgi:hypothetical protein
MLITVLSLNLMDCSLSYASDAPHSYDRALDLNDEIILRVSSFLRKVQKIEHFSKKTPVVSGGIYIKRNEGTITIAVKDGSDFRLSKPLLIFNGERIQGLGFKRIKEKDNITFEALEMLSTDELFQHDFIFTGKGLMGVVALWSALQFKRFLIDHVKLQQNTPSQYDLGQNRVKAILFNAPQVSDDNFIKSIREYIGIENILNFSQYNLKDIFLTSTRYKNIGLCLDILPFENLMDIKSQYTPKALGSVIFGIIGGWALSKLGYPRFKGIPILIGGVYFFTQIQEDTIPSDAVLRMVMSYVRSRKVEIGELWPVEEVGKSTFLTYNRGISLLIQKALEQIQLRSSL